MRVVDCVYGESRNACKTATGRLCRATLRKPRRRGGEINFLKEVAKCKRKVTVQKIL
jgi:hypothetical protein